MTEKMLLASKFRPKRLQLEEAKTCPSWEWAFQPLVPSALVVLATLKAYPLSLLQNMLISWLKGVKDNTLGSLGWALVQFDSNPECAGFVRTKVLQEKVCQLPANNHPRIKALPNETLKPAFEHSTLPQKFIYGWNTCQLHATVWAALFSAKHGWSIHPGFCPHLRLQHLLCVAQAIFRQQDLRSQSSCFSSTEHNHEAHCEAFCSKLPHLYPLGTPILWQPRVFRWEKQPNATSSQKRPLHAAPWELCCGTCQEELNYYPLPSTIARRLGCQILAAWGHGQGNKISFLAVQGLCVLAGGECICIGLCWSLYSKNCFSWYAVFARD